MCQRSQSYLLKVRPGTMVSWCLKASRAWIRHWIWHRSGGFGCTFHLVFPHTTWSLSIFSISLVETGHNENYLYYLTETTQNKQKSVSWYTSSIRLMTGLLLFFFTKCITNVLLSTSLLIILHALFLFCICMPCFPNSMELQWVFCIMQQVRIHVLFLILCF